MTQTLDSMTWRNAKVELSSDGSTWIDVSGSISSVTLNGGTRSIMEIRPLFADTVKGLPGARDRVSITIKSIYTEVLTEARDILDIAYLSGAELFFRWSPTGGGGGDRRYRAYGARVVRPSFAGGDASDAKPMMADYELSAEYIQKETA